ncbi:MAG: response regulator transcription factor [Anaerolineaceae bacterium]|nr:response regulator transcription factor [Anaerolineaceae bacterium]
MAIKQNTIRVMIVDDHEMIRRGLIDFLKVFDNLEFVGEASNGEEAVLLFSEIQPDVVLMDMIMPVMDGVEATRKIMQEFPGSHIIALTSFEDEQLVPKALEAGAISYLQKNIPMDDLADAIRKAVLDQPILSKEATQTLISAATRTTKPGFNLTSRELNVLSLIVKGKSNAEIGEALSISTPTVKTHIRSIFQKMGIKNRTEAVVLAIEYKLVSK